MSHPKTTAAIVFPFLILFSVAAMASDNRLQNQFTYSPRVQIAQSEQVGCCLLKPYPVKSSWQYTDSEIRRECARAAATAGVEWDFFPNKKCATVRGHGAQ